MTWVLQNDAELIENWDKNVWNNPYFWGRGAYDNPLKSIHDVHQYETNTGSYTRPSYSTTYTDFSSLFQIYPWYVFLLYRPYRHLVHEHEPTSLHRAGHGHWERRMNFRGIDT